MRILFISIITLISLIPLYLCSYEDGWSVVIDLTKNDKMDEARGYLSTIILNSQGDDLLIASEILSSTYKYSKIPKEDLIGIFNVIINKHKRYNYEELTDNIEEITERVGGFSIISSESAEIYQGMGDYEMSLSTYQRLYDNYPTDDNAVWFLYNIFLLKKLLDEDDVDKTRGLIIDNYPGSIPSVILSTKEETNG